LLHPCAHEWKLDRMRRKAQAVRSTQKRARILLVDDHPLVRERLAEIINREADLIISGEAEDRQEALDAILAKPPDLVIVDLTLKNSDGLELIKDVRVRWPRMRMLVVSMHDESLYAERVIRAGAMGYITKQEATRKILLAIRRVLSGSIYLNEKIANRILTRLTDHADPITGTPTELLTDREFQVFELTGRGLNTHDIADRLNIAVKTVETYRSRIKEKLKVKDASELLQFAITWSRNQ
jgi:DNA-binding NarL/FixJ family response regulator